MVRLGKVLGVAAVVTAVLLAAGWMLMPTAIERLAPDRIRAAASARGLEVRWSGLKWLPAARALELRGVTVVHPRGELSVSVVTVAVDLEFRPARVEAVGVVGAMDVSHAGAEGEGPERLGAGGVRVSVRDARLDVRRGEQGLARVRVEHAKLRGSRLEQAWVVVEPTDARLPRYVRAKVFQHDGALHVHPDGAEHLLDTDVPGLGHLRVEQARLWWDGRFEAEAVELERGSLRALARTVGRDRLGWAVRGARIHHGGRRLAEVTEGRYADGTVWALADVLGGSVEAAVSADGSLWLTGRDLDLRNLPLPPRIRARGRADVELSAASLDDDVLARAEVRVAGVELAWDAIADAPLTGMAAAFDGDLEWRDGRLALEDATLHIGPTRTRLRAWVDDALDDPVVSVRSETDPVDCQAALGAIPAALFGPYDRVKATGTAAPTVRLDWPVHRPGALSLKVRALVTACRITALDARASAWPEVEVSGRDDVEWLTQPFSLRVREGTTRPVFVGPASPGFVPLGQLPRYLGAAMYLSEEIGFYGGHGINRGLIQRAFRLNLEGGRFVYGGSTVTQQLVKNLFLTRRKTLARKFQEALIAERVALAVGKNRVLELYVNCIEFGPNVYGVGPAARFYFQKDARALTPKEAVFLAMIKPAPGRGAGMRRRGHTPERGTWWPSRAEEIFRRLVEHGYLTPAAAEAERPFHVIRWEDGRHAP